MRLRRRRSDRVYRPRDLVTAPVPRVEVTRAGLEQLRERIPSAKKHGNPLGALSAFPPGAVPVYVVKGWRLPRIRIVGPT